MRPSTPGKLLPFIPPLCALLLVSPCAAMSGDVAVSAPDSVALAAECEYGIALALAGKTAAAESVFVSLLSHSPGDARALTNLGNVHLLRGDADVALVFYAQALEVEPGDPGILLDRSTAFVLQGDETRARAEAERAVQLAGGAQRAGALLGVRISTEPTAAEKAADRPSLSKDEVRELLLAAAASVQGDSALAQAPADSVAAADASAPAKSDAPSRRGTGRRSAGPRSADRSDAQVLLYWKR